jgi:hypothetical protein
MPAGPSNLFLAITNRLKIHNYLAQLSHFFNFS